VSEFRQDRTSGAWVIIAPERGSGPRQWQRRDIAADEVRGVDRSCPFCPGNERLLPAIIEEIPADRPPAWRTRVVPNRYPAVRPENTPGPAPAEAGPVLPAYGYHEVIIETARHDSDLAALSPGDLNAVVFTYRRRYVELMARPAVEAVLVFRNHGRRSGASLLHPHSQVIATGLTPPRLAAKTAWARSHYARATRCITCEQVELELEDGRRVVEATERFLVIVPFAAASPFEQWILPRRHQASFAQAEDGELIELGQLLQRALCRLKAALDDPPYRYAIESGSAGEADAPYMHWGLRIVPDLVTAGGFELGGGLPINPSRPEDDAEALCSAAAAARRV
jgi:UDPglucose--hexose-1-phosphate uridylyltransferase